MKFLLLVVTAATMGCRSADHSDAGRGRAGRVTGTEDAVQAPLNIEVSGWAAYDHEGENFIHLWSPGAPKSVFIVREADAPPGFLEAIRRSLPMVDRVRVELLRYDEIRETATTAEIAKMPSEVIFHHDGAGYGDDRGDS